MHLNNCIKFLFLCVIKDKMNRAYTDQCCCFLSVRLASESLSTVANRLSTTSAAPV